MLSFYFNSSECTYKFVLGEELLIHWYCLSELWFLFIEGKRGVVKLVFGCRENMIFVQPSLVEDDVQTFNFRVQRIMKSSLNTKLVFNYNNTIARSLVQNSPAPLEAEGGVYNVPCLEYSDKYFGETIKSQYQDISSWIWCVW